MRDFNYIKEAQRLSDFNSFSTVSKLCKYSGQEQTMRIVAPEVMHDMEKAAHIQTVTSASRGHELPFDRRLRLIDGTVAPKNTNEAILLGYSNAFSSVFTNKYKSENLHDNIQTLYRILCAHEPAPDGPLWREHEKVELGMSGGRKVKRLALPHKDVSVLFRKACEQYLRALSEPDINPLFLIPVFLLDTEAIRPFEYGSGLMLMLMAVYLLHSGGYSIGRYVSMESVMVREKQRYYDALAKSLVNWERSVNEYRPFFDYFMDICCSACDVFSSWTTAMASGPVTKGETVHMVLKIFGGRMNKRMIWEFIPSVSRSTIEITLADLIKRGEIRKIGGGRYTMYEVAG